ncbi:MAG: BatD family protein [Alphaproteobacteria bacterium]|nr:BatD family protein [Alphaproteobacteria bacterium]
MKKILLSVGLVMTCLTAYAATTVRFDPATVALGESTQLVFETDRPLSAEPDLSGLIGHFAVAGHQESSETIQINGRRRSKHLLSYTVFPRHAGTLSTGDLTINGETIEPAILTVEEAGSPAGLPIVFRAITNTQTAYPEQAVLWTAQLVYATSLLDAKIMPPIVENARVLQLDADKTYQALSNNQPVRVFERTYVVIPEKSGTMVIPGVEVYGAVPANNTMSAADLFDQGMLFNGLLGGQKDIRLESNAISIRVLPKPTDWKGWWLPANAVSLTVDDSFPDVIRAGDSLTRVLTLTADGVTGEQLPTLTYAGRDGLKVYPSPEKRETKQTEDGFIQGIETVSFVLVPTKSGTITIPEMRLSWFNVQTQQREEAIVPEKVLTVEAGAEGEVVPPVVTPKTYSADETSRRQQAKESPSVAVQEDVKTDTDKSVMLHLYWVVGLGCLALGGGLILGFFLSRKRRSKSYYSPDLKVSRAKKRKKPLPDLYPF